MMQTALLTTNKRKDLILIILARFQSCSSM